MSRAGLMAAVVMGLSLAPSAGVAGTPVGKKELTGVVNINTATAAQLDMLPGVGEKAAKKIIEHRTKTPFARPEDLTRVKGFGPKKLAKLKGLITTTGPTTLTVSRGQEEAQGRAAPPRR